MSIAAYEVVEATSRVTMRKGRGGWFVSKSSVPDLVGLQARFRAASDTSLLVTDFMLGGALCRDQIGSSIYDNPEAHGVIMCHNRSVVFDALTN